MYWPGGACKGRAPQKYVHWTGKNVYRVDGNVGVEHTCPAQRHLTSDIAVHVLICPLMTGLFIWEHATQCSQNGYNMLQSENVHFKS